MQRRTIDLPKDDQAILARVCETLIGQTRPRHLYWINALLTSEGYDVNVRGVPVDTFLNLPETQDMPDEFRTALRDPWPEHEYYMVLAIHGDTLTMCRVRIEPPVLN